jgi:hypothetical protein
MRGSSVIFRKLPKVNNNPLGEYSTNLVTLTGLSVCTLVIYDPAI